MRKILLALLALLIDVGFQTPVFAKPAKPVAEVADVLDRKSVDLRFTLGKPSAAMDVLYALEQVGRDSAAIHKRFGPDRACKMVHARVAVVVARLKSPEQVGLMAVQGACLNRSAAFVEDWSWDDLGHSVYIACLDRLSKDHTLSGQKALRRVAESLRGELFYSHNADMWIQAAILQNGDHGDLNKSAWYLDQALIQKYAGTAPSDVVRLQEQAKKDIKNQVKIPENIAPSDL